MRSGASSVPPLEIMDTVKRLELIETTLTRRGSGKDSHSPVRVVTQLWTTAGQLVMERDPAAVTVTPEMRLKIREAIYARLGENDTGRKAYDAVLEALSDA